ncbi:MAG TPA: hypothetical protein VHE11_06355 [Steroidobacteraceae bacterium]|nr:hypothetical protein [Steroidobacteraceae bacterium]
MSGATRPQSGQPSSSGASPPRQGAGDFAYDGYAPLDCELPAGCGASGAEVNMIRTPSGTSGETPSAHNTGSSQQTGGSGTQSNPDPTSDNTPPGNGSDDPPQHSDPPVASAPELDPATLAGAATLLLGALAIVSGRRRRVRATR